MSALTSSDVIEWKNANNASIKDTAKHFGVSEKTVSKYGTYVRQGRECFVRGGIVDSETTIDALIEKRNRLDELINQKITSEKADKINELKDVISRYNIKSSDLFSSPKNAFEKYDDRESQRTEIYRNPITGQTWSGYGRPPLWLSSVKDRSQYRVIDY